MQINSRKRKLHAKWEIPRGLRAVKQKELESAWDQRGSFRKALLLGKEDDLEEASFT